MERENEQEGRRGERAASPPHPVAPRSPSWSRRHRSTEPLLSSRTRGEDECEERESSCEERESSAAVPPSRLHHRQTALLLLAPSDLVAVEGTVIVAAVGMSFKGKRRERPGRRGEERRCSAVPRHG
ncbi:uncharacterized protein DS421_8g240870 [Arachis hypogaea]|nr:uncharacterized protein DS421_8g240870 [Arachis hypogaea]